MGDALSGNGWLDRILELGLGYMEMGLVRRHGILDIDSERIT